MIDQRIGAQIQKRRKQLGLTQEQFAEKVELSTNYISAIERGAAFPRCEKLIEIINCLETSADAIFCDVISHSQKYHSSRFAEDLEQLPFKERQRIFEILEFLICQAQKSIN